ncbi:diguanylate cyclase domain-containing protein [Arenimonas sp. MALMAid1274]|uniref:diguanylate cyclase domain-containing protein n=1 Tax=Arenimonas sp. MALMAid1274 TaxID=3411630 RepID=UPI003BA15352
MQAEFGNRRAPPNSLAVLLLLLAVGLVSPVFAQSSPAPAPNALEPRADTLERHPLETRALVEPEAVLRELSSALINAKVAGDPHQLALLYLAQANACRVVADWDCQREAGMQAQAAAREAARPHLVVRGLIAESRARMAMQDYTRGERLLGEAELLLKQSPQPELSADVYLAYSSMSYSLGKHALAADYARRGLAVLAENEGLAMQARLQRNLARAQAQLGEVEGAGKALDAATALSQRVQDPKLAAELYLEGARVARIVGDFELQRRNGGRVLALAEQLKNSQLAGLGHEVLGLAAADARDGPLARQELRAALDSFRQLQLQSDELRVLRELVTVLLRHEPTSPELAPLFQRFLALDNAIAQSERAQAADDFDARLKYAERENEVIRLQGESALAQEREQTLAQTNQQNRRMMAVGVLCLLALATFFVVQRRSKQRLESALSQLGQRELEYRTLADNSNDMVVREALDGRWLYVSPSTREILGMDPEALRTTRWDFVHPEDRPRLEAMLVALRTKGDTATMRFRARHGGGHQVWIEAVARRVPAADGSEEIVWAGRDVSGRVRAEQALEAIQSRLRAVTDNIPALIAHVDRQERYTFVNSVGHRLFDTEEAGVLGRTVREVRGEAIYSEIKDHVAAALAGQRVTYNGQAEIKGRSYHYQTSYVPDLDAEGRSNGFFSFTYDITQLKDAEQRLEQIARFDALTGLANRRYFDERLSATVARAKRQRSSLALLYLDIDHFKLVNDRRGHASGDEVLREFARRLKACVREGDLAARIGGDEFALLVEGPGSVADAEAIADKLVKTMREPIRIAGTDLPVGTSIGIAFSLASADADRLLLAADEALYAAKAAGRGTWRVVPLA